METLNVGSNPLAALTPRSNTDRGIASLSSEDFFKILVSELQTQDPLEPSKTSDMIGQVSQIRTIELSTKLGDTLDRLVQQQRVAGVSDLLGKFITAQAVGPDGSFVTTEGVVTGVTFASDGKAVLELDTGQAVRIADVVHVSTLEEQAQLETSSTDSNDLVEPLATQKQDGQARVRQAPKTPAWLNLDWRLRL